MLSCHCVHMFKICNFTCALLSNRRKRLYMLEQMKMDWLSLGSGFIICSKKGVIDLSLNIIKLKSWSMLKLIWK